MSNELENGMTHSAEQAFIDAYKKKHPELSDAEIRAALKLFGQMHD